MAMYRDDQDSGAQGVGWGGVEWWFKRAALGDSDRKRWGQCGHFQGGNREAQLHTHTHIDGSVTQGPRCMAVSSASVTETSSERHSHAQYVIYSIQHQE